LDASSDFSDFSDFSSKFFRTFRHFSAFFGPFFALLPAFSPSSWTLAGPIERSAAMLGRKLPQIEAAANIETDANERPRNRSSWAPINQRPSRATLGGSGGA